MKQNVEKVLVSDSSIANILNTTLLCSLFIERWTYLRGQNIVVYNVRAWQMSQF